MSLISWLKSKIRKKPPIELRTGTAEFELFIAQGELETRNDLGHGLRHLACLLDYDPVRPQWLRMLEEYLEAIGEGADRLLPEDEERYYAYEALRAFIWQRQGRF